MIAVNDSLGCEVTGVFVEWQKHLAGTAGPAP